MRRSFWYAALACLAVCASPSASNAVVSPSPAKCLFPVSIAACPGGDVAYVVSIRDITNSPIYAETVTLDFSGCPGAHLCPPGPAANYTLASSTSAVALTDVHGDATFNLEAGGTCASAIKITATSGPLTILLTDGVNHAPVSLAGLDQDGDGVVTTTDQLILSAKGPGDPTADFNADGVHDSADEAALALHLGHACPSLPTPTSHRSWGAIKLIYR